MKIFNLDTETSILCNFKETRQGFKHEAVLFLNGIEQRKAKVCYLNRTWERFEYESILQDIIGKHFHGDEKTKFLKVVSELN